MTHKEKNDYVKVAIDIKRTLYKSPFINSTALQAINSKLGNMFTKEFTKVFLGSVNVDTYTDKVISILDKFINANEKLSIPIDRASKLIGQYGELIASKEYSERVLAIDLDVNWIEENNPFTYLKDDAVKSVCWLSIEKALESAPEAFSGFIGDVLLVDTVKATIKENPSLINNISIYSILFDDIIAEEKLKAFSTQIYAKIEDGYVEVDPLLLDYIELATWPSIKYVLELRNEILRKIQDIRKEK